MNVLSSEKCQLTMEADAYFIMKVGFKSWLKFTWISESLQVNSGE